MTHPTGLSVSKDLFRPLPQMNLVFHRFNRKVQKRRALHSQRTEFCLSQPLDQWFSTCGPCPLCGSHVYVINPNTNVTVMK
ncbi:hypothetical protein ACRRTK_010840 [Alexandromys fortis]